MIAAKKVSRTFLGRNKARYASCSSSVCAALRHSRGGRKVQGTFLAHEQGSFTIEISIFITLLFYIVIFMIYMGLLFFQEARVQTIANATAHRGAKTYYLNDRDLYVARVNEKTFQNRNPYRRLLKPKNAQAKTEQYLNTQQKSFSILKNVGGGGDSVTISGNILYRVIKVDLSQSYNVPMGGVMELFGIEMPYQTSAHAEAVVVDPAEFIRNVDLSIDVVKTADRHFGGHLGNAMQKFKKGFDYGFVKIMNIFK